ncbi:MAG: 3'(2'), 5'-bisphosphate nucleotidase [Flavobacteriaceae bacterium]|jgi:3'(2'), 5'-bisphosphate nucleotidase
MNNLALPDIYYRAIEASIEASKVIAQVYTEDVTPTIKGDGSPVTKADLAASAVISRILEKTGIPILGEELEKDSYEVRSKWTQNWCVDPLDGTRMFLMKNGEFGVCIAHIVNGRAVFGIIADPLNEKILIGGTEFGAFILPFESVQNKRDWLELKPLEKANDPLNIICSRSYTVDKHVDQISAHIPHGRCAYIRKGSALKFFDLALGQADVYPRFAPTMEWDIAAGQAILEAVGGSVIDINTNEALTYNKESLFNPHFIAKTNVVG